MKEKELQLMSDYLRDNKDCIQIVKSWMRINEPEVLRKLDAYMLLEASPNIKKVWK